MKTTDTEEPEHVDFEMVKDRVIDDMTEIRFLDWAKELRNGANVRIIYKRP